MNYKHFAKVLVLLFVLVSTLQTVSAWGVLPARQLADYADGVNHYTFTLRNTGLDEGYFQIEFAGDLSTYATYDGPSTIFFEPSTSEKYVPITLDLDTSKLQPGKNTLRVIFKQIPKEGDVTVGASVTLVAELVVSVPYAGDFVEAKLYTSKSSPKEPTPFEIALLNKGEGPVSVYADVFVRGPTNKIIDSWTTDPFILGFQQAEKIRTYWVGQKETGTYLVETIVHYGSKSTMLHSTFAIGAKEVVVSAIDSERFRLGEINKITLSARNTWNERLDAIHAELFVVDKEGSVLQSFTTSSMDFPAFASQKMEAFWDTTDLVVGDYSLNVVMYVDKENFQYTFPVTVAVDNLQTSALTGQVTASDGEGSTNGLIMIILIAVLITNVVLIIYFRKRKK